MNLFHNSKGNHRSLLTSIEAYSQFTKGNKEKITSGILLGALYRVPLPSPGATKLPMFQTRLISIMFYKQLCYWLSADRDSSTVLHFVKVN